MRDLLLANLPSRSNFDSSIPVEIGGLTKSQTALQKSESPLLIRTVYSFRSSSTAISAGKYPNIRPPVSPLRKSGLRSDLLLPHPPFFYIYLSFVLSSPPSETPFQLPSANLTSFLPVPLPPISLASWPIPGRPVSCPSPPPVPKRGASPLEACIWRT